MENTFLVDVREKNELKASSIESAFSLPLSSIKTMTKCSDMPIELRKAAEEGKEIVFFCLGGIRSQAAASHLESICRSMNHVLSMKGGIKDWARSVDPSVVH